MPRSHRPKDRSVTMVRCVFPDQLASVSWSLKGETGAAPKPHVIALVTSILPWLLVVWKEDSNLSANTHQLLAEC